MQKKFALMFYRRPGRTVDRDRKYFGFKKINQNRRVLSIYGRSYLIYLIIGTQIGTNFTVERCKLCFKTVIGKIFSK